MTSFSKREDVNRLMRAIRSQATDELVVPLDRSDHFVENCAVFGIIGDSHSSIRHVIHRHNGFAPYLTVADGVERWHFYSTHSSPQDILDDIPKSCKARVGRTPLLSKFHDAPMLVDHSRVALLRTALMRGYFDYPRRFSLTALALQLGVTKSSLSQSLRRALKEVLTETIMVYVEESPTEAATKPDRKCSLCEVA